MAVTGPTVSQKTAGKVTHELKIDVLAQPRPPGFRIWNRMTDYRRIATLATLITERHRLAALFLFATYLMIPLPRLVGDHFQINFSAPLSKGDQLRLFNSDAECEAALESYRQKPPGDLPAMLGSRTDAISAMRAAKCIPTHDPRLK
jgi:hypothetical protein